MCDECIEPIYGNYTDKSYEMNLVNWDPEGVTDICLLVNKLIPWYRVCRQSVEVVKDSLLQTSPTTSVVVLKTSNCEKFLWITHAERFPLQSIL